MFPEMILQFFKQSPSLYDQVSYVTV